MLQSESNYLLGFVRDLKKWKEKNEEKWNKNNLLVNLIILVSQMKMSLRNCPVYIFYLYKFLSIHFLVFNIIKMF